MSKSTLHTFILAAIALFCAMAVYGVLAYVVVGKRALATSRATDRATLGSRQLELATLKAALVETAEDRAALHEFIVTDDRLTEFLALVEGSARAQGLKASTRSVDIVRPAGPFEELHVVLEAEGSYEGLKRLIALFETMPFHIDMEDIAIDRSDDVWHGVFAFSVTKERTR
jgi:hypothetical protein